MSQEVLIGLLPLALTLSVGLISVAFIAMRTSREWQPIAMESQGLVPHSVSFQGASIDYFLMWIGVVFLNIITLGLYSPWGTVRLKKYFYSQAGVGSLSFSFLGDPIAILKGRLLLVGVFIAVMVLSSVAPTLYGVVLVLAYLVGLPWLLPRAMRYSARTTALSNVPFAFTGTSGGAFFAYVLGTIGSFSTLWIAAPICSRYALGYRYNNLEWGGKRLGVSVSLGQLYKALGTAVATGVTSSVVVAGLFWAAAKDLGDSQGAMSFLPLVVLYFGFFPAAIAYRTLQLRLVLASLVVEGMGRLRCTLSAGRAVSVACSNALVMALTLGLATPWARVRWMKVLAASLVFESLPGKLTVRSPQDQLPTTATDELAEAVFSVEF